MSGRKIYIDENGKTEFDFTDAISVFEPHELANMYSGFLSDVDFVIEQENEIVFLEYKNSCMPGLANPGILYEKVTGRDGKFWNIIAKKFFGTIFLLWATKRNESEKKIKYILLIETNPEIDNVLKKRLKQKMITQLPFKYKRQNDIKREVIYDFDIMDLSQWANTYPCYKVVVKGN